MRSIPKSLRAHVHTPRDEDDLKDLIARATHDARVLRVVGAAHSTPAAIADPGDFLVSLEHMRRMVDYDAVNGRVTVQTGMTLGPSQAWPNRPVDETLGGFLEAQAKARGSGWALPLLGGITHQTVGGFLATGSSGGSIQYSMGDALHSIRFIDGLGNEREVRAGEDLFDAVAVSMGLLGVVTRVTFQCVPWYDIIGRETTTTTDDCEIDLFGDRANSLREFLIRTPYARLLWWPQPEVNKMTVWQARRMEEPDYLAHHSSPTDLSARPYEAIGIPGQMVADAFYSILALRYGTDLLDRCIEAVAGFVVPKVINAFVPVNSNDPTLFWDTWNNGLPMDNKSSDWLMPTDFTELWIPIERTREVMVALRDHYLSNGLAAAGTYACEIYAAKRSPFWLSPAYEQDVVRVDIFWFAKNLENAATGFYPQFWSLLRQFDFRPHWGKTLPAADSDMGADFLRQRYPRWDGFMAMREELDPSQLFVSDYWRRHLGIARARARRSSIVVPRDPAAPLSQSG